MPAASLAVGMTLTIWTRAAAQGPPGTGKTRTLLALIALVCGAAQSEGAAFANDFGAQHNKHVCMPSKQIVGQPVAVK